MAGMCMLLVCLDVGGCKPPKEQSAAERIRQEQNLEQMSPAELRQRLETIRKQILIAAHNSYRIGKADKAADCLQWYHESAGVISAALEESESVLPSNVVRLAQILIKLRKITGANDSLLTPSELNAIKNIGNVATGTTIVPAGLSLGAAGLSGYFAGWVVPAVRGIEKQVGRLVEMFREQNKDMISMNEPNLVRWNAEPGGQPLFDFMVAIKKDDDIATVRQSINNKVMKYFGDNRSNLDNILGTVNGKKYRPIPTKGTFFKEVDSAKFPEWVKYHIDDIWLLLYGDLEVPQEWTPAQ